MTNNRLLNIAINVGLYYVSSICFIYFLTKCVFLEHAAASTIFLTLGLEFNGKKTSSEVAANFALYSILTAIIYYFVVNIIAT